MASIKYPTNFMKYLSSLEQWLAHRTGSTRYLERVRYKWCNFPIHRCMYLCIPSATLIRKWRIHRLYMMYLSSLNFPMNSVAIPIVGIRFAWTRHARNCGSTHKFKTFTNTPILPFFIVLHLLSFDFNHPHHPTPFPWASPRCAVGRGTRPAQSARPERLRSAAPDARPRARGARKASPRWWGPQDPPPEEDGDLNWRWNLWKKGWVYDINSVCVCWN